VILTLKIIKVKSCKVPMSVLELREIWTSLVTAVMSWATQLKIVLKVLDK